MYLASVSVVTTVKWFWFVIATCLLVCVIASFARGFKESANLRGPDVSSLYGQLAALTMICFIAYPVRGGDAGFLLLLPTQRALYCNSHTVC
jgi:bacteriorhodopsin